MTLSSHVLDGARGLPAEGVAITWETLEADEWRVAGNGLTGADGRVTDWGGEATLGKGRHRLVFRSGDYFARQGTRTFYPEVVVVFEVTDADAHHHVPLLLSPFAYSTYRGS